MPRLNSAAYAFNRGTVSKSALARVDVDRLRLSAETQTNWLPRTVGPMTLRPGLEYIAETRNSFTCRLVPFVYSTEDTALLECTPGYMRVLIDGEPIARETVDTIVDDFDVPASWSLTTSGTGVAGITGSGLNLRMDSAGSAAKATQTVTVGASANKEHALRITVTRGPVKFRVGSTSGDDDVFATATLEDGTHSLAFTPTGNFYIQFEASELSTKFVSSCALEAAGVMTIATPWTGALLDDMRWTQSADVVFVACKGIQQRRIERRSERSWSVVKYKSNDGPFNSSNDPQITIATSQVLASTTLTASRPLFRSSHVGSLIRLFHTGQIGYAELSAENTFSNAVRVSGVGVDRYATLEITGTWTGTLTLQRSFDSEDSGFTDYATYVANTAATINDGLTNSIVWYRIGFKTGDYGSGTATVRIGYPGGGGAGIARIIGYTDSTTVSAEILSQFYNVTATSNWKFGAWSDKNGYPTAVRLHEGRLCWAGNDRFWLSVSDAYNSFDPDYEGDAGPIDRTIGEGPIANVAWLESLTRLLGGTDVSVVAARSSSFDEPLTPTNFNLKVSSTQGAATVPAVKVDNRAVYVQQGNRRVYEIVFDVSIGDYKVNDLTRLNEDIGKPGFVDIAVQRQPDTRIHFVREDGKVACLLYDTQDQVEAWWLIQTDGFVESVAVLPGTLEDEVYYVVRRSINGNVVRYIERFARLDECEGGSLSKLADSHVAYEGTATTAITGLDHLEGETVVVWADGADVGTFTVNAGAITLDTAAENVCVGLGYDATFKSAKLAYAAAGGTALNQKKRIDHLGLILQNTHMDGIQYGQDENHLDPLPLMEKGKATDADYVWDMYDEDMVELNGSWDTDARLVITASAPRPATVMSAVVAITTNG